MLTQKNPLVSNALFIYNSLPTILLDLNFIIKEINQSALNLLKYPKNELIGESLISLCFETSAFTINRSKISSLIKGDINNYKTFKNFVDRNKKILPLEVSVSLTKSPSRNEQLMFCTLSKPSLSELSKKIKIDINKLDTLNEGSISLQYIKDLKNNCVLHENKKLSRYLGYTKEDIGNLSELSFINNLLGKKQITKNKKALKEYLDSEDVNAVLELEYKLKSKLGKTHCFYDKSVALKIDSDGNKLYNHGTIIDITDKKQNESRIKKQQEFIEKISSSIEEFTYMIDVKSGTISFTNQHCKNILGYSEDEYMNLLNEELVHSKYFVDFIKKNKNISQNKKKKSFKQILKLKHKTKGFRWYKIRSFVFERNDDNKPKTILRKIEDINSQIKNLNTKKEQKNLIETIANAMENFIYLFNVKQNKYVYTNFENRRILGYTKSEYLENKLDIVHTAYLKKIELAKKQLQFDPTKNNTEVEIILKSKSGELIWTNYKIIVLARDNEGKVEQVIEIIENINESKKKALQIVEQQNLIEKISSSVPEFIYLKDYNTNELIFSNSKSKDILGYTDTEYALLDKKDIIHPKHLKRLNEYQNKIIENRKKRNFDIDILIKHKNEDYRWYRNKSIVFERDENETPTKTIEIVLDIHESKLNELQIREQEKFIKNVTNTIPQYISVYDLRTQKCIYKNFQGKLIFGYTADEYLKLSNNIIHPDYKEKTSELANKMVNSKEDNLNNSIELLIKHKTKGYIWASLKILITKRNKKGIATHALEIIDNINTAKKSYDQVIEQQNFIQKIASTVPNIIQVINTQNNQVMYSNFDDRSFLGYDKFDWEKSKLDIIHPKFYKEYLSDLEDLIYNAKNNTTKHELLIQDKNGEYKWVLAINTAFKVENKKTTQIMSIFQDIHKTKELQLNLEQQLSKNIELERFASITSHDLKEPLRTISNYTQILTNQFQEELPEDAKELLDFIINSTKRMNNLINDILDFSKVQTGGKKYTKLDLNSSLGIVLEDLKELISESKCIIEFEKLPIVLGDKTQLRQVFQNLISNAIKFSRGKNSKIKIKSSKKNNSWIIAIKDNGIGIKESEQKSIFSIFKKLHNQEEFEGQGIGLSICKRIVERHNGEIWLESKIGCGTTFYFSLPIV